MAAKVLLVLCAQALLLQVVLSQCVRPSAAPACAYTAPCGGSGLTGLALSGIGIAPTSGGALPVSSTSVIGPIGLSIVSENVFEGLLAAAGELPFVGTVALEGVLPTAGAGAVNHACGDGHVAMISGGAPGAAYGHGAGAYGVAGAYGHAGGAYAPAVAGYAAGAGYGARSCGCGPY